MQGADGTTGSLLWVAWAVSWLDWDPSFSQQEGLGPQYLFAYPFSILACKIIF